MRTSNSYCSLGQVILKTRAIQITLGRLTWPTKCFCGAQCFFPRRHRTMTIAATISAHIDEFCPLYLFHLARNSQTAAADGRMGDDSFCWSAVTLASSSNCSHLSYSLFPSSSSSLWQKLGFPL